MLCIPARREGEVRLLFLVAAMAVLMVEVAALSGRIAAPHQFMAIDPNAYHPFFAWAVAGIFVTHALMRGASRDVRHASFVGIVLMTLHGLLLGYGAAPAWVIVGTAAYYQGIGSALLLGWMAWRGRGSTAGSDFATILMASCPLPLFVLLSRPFLALSATLQPVTLDALLFQFDDSLGFRPSTVFASAVLGNAWLRDGALLAYAALPLLVAVSSSLQLRHGSRDDSPNITGVFLAMAAAGFFIYFVCPAAGPLYFLGDAFPHRVPALDAVPSVAPAAMSWAPRNCLPSLHMAWAFAMWSWARREHGTLRLPFGAFVAMTAVATLGLGEHYLIDLVIALPFAVMVGAACAPRGRPGRSHAIAAGAVMTCGWLAYFLFGPRDYSGLGLPHALMIVLTLLLSVLAERYAEAARTTSEAPASATETR